MTIVLHRVPVGGVVWGVEMCGGVVFCGGMDKAYFSVQLRNKKS